MEALAGVGVMFWLALVGTLWMLVFVPFYIAAKLRGVERALWAIVSQLRALRPSEFKDLTPLMTRREGEAGNDPGHVFLSMFGR